MGNATTEQKLRRPGKLLIFSGIPGSGKTTAAEKELSRIRSGETNAIRLSRDDLREFMFGADYHLGAPVGWCEVKVSAVFMKLLHHYLEDGFTVICDALHIRYRDVKPLIKVAEKLNATVEHIAIVVPLETALERNRRRGSTGGRFVPEEVIEAAWHRQQRVIADGSGLPANLTIGE